VLPALRAGVATVMLPARNRRDLDEIPTDARDQLNVVLVKHVDDAIAAARDPCSVETEVARGSGSAPAAD
jgi:ATP-dependent Lon protease